MTEFLSIILLIGMGILASNSSMYFNSLHDIISTAIIFFIVIRLFRFYLNNKIYSQNKKALYFSFIYTLTFLDGLLGVLYFSHYLDDLIWLKTIVEIFINLSVFIAFLFIKYKDIKERKEYSKTYFHYQIVDLVVVFILFVLSILIRPALLLKYSILSITIVSLLIFDLCVKLYIDKKRPYWYHKKVLYTYFDIIIQTKRLDDILKEPLERVVSNDYILSESRYVMQFAFMRAYALNEITKVFYDKCRQHGMSNNDSIKYTALLSALLMTNLMKRQFDFAVMPTFIVNPLQFVIRKFKYKHNYKGNY